MTMPEPLPAEPCKTLAEALAALQARLPRVAKDHTASVTSQRTGKTHKYDYADLTDVSEAILPVMASLGLSFTACPTMVDGQFVLDYALRHVSGSLTSVGGLYPLPTEGTPQEVGSAITYARRYTLCAVTGLAPGGDDDDGQGAEQEHQQRLRQPVSAQDRERAKTTHLKAGTSRLARAQEEDPWAQDAPVDGQRAAALREAPAEDRPGSSNPKQHQQLGILYGQIGITERASRLADVTDRLGREVTSAKDLSYAEAESAIRDLRELAKESAK
jgi:ERF superfamily